VESCQQERGTQGRAHKLMTAAAYRIIQYEKHTRNESVVGMYWSSPLSPMKEYEALNAINVRREQIRVRGSDLY
jgi:hypothetical protein